MAMRLSASGMGPSLVLFVWMDGGNGRQNGYGLLGSVFVRV